MSDAGSDARQHAPAAARNRDPIARELARILPSAGMVLEVASGSGEHAVHFARLFPKLQWQPTDPSAEALASIAAWRAQSGLSNLLPPVQLDAASDQWRVQSADAMFCANMIHIAPWRAAEGLMAGAGRVLAPGGGLITYGPYLEPEVETAASNLAFDRSLKDRNPQWGLRDRTEVEALAARNGLSLSERVAMPANNLLLVWRKD